LRHGDIREVSTTITWGILWKHHVDSQDTPPNHCRYQFRKSSKRTPQKSEDHLIGDVVDAERLL
jgi:hypothetical protein